MENLFELIGESAPYVTVYDVAVDNGVVYSKFKPEQRRYAETTLMSCSEGFRTLAVHGVLACAVANPIKSRHYYLATKADLQVFPVHATTTDFFRCVGRVDRIEQSKRFTFYTEAVTCFTAEGERYAVLDVEYVGLNEEEFVKAKGTDAAPAVVLAPGQPGPYVDPVRPMQIEWIKPGEALRATLEGFRREDFAGHFATRAMCPVSILGGNVCSLLRHFPGFDAYQITRCVLTCKHASLPGEPLQLSCVREGAGHFMVTAHNDSGRLLSTFHIDVQAHRP
ncbi:hypothetical protein BO221_42570 [Archangium sp. Cb G35]|uniref:hypothetical protein n=1 Tax=Archangium sp. Cb G35 TaxID=1920190 RepID=UPI0009374E73|nr:hypothetical protein [Archangium sp. Cb G35]OJT18171.1 hypothetical protein BO221_42570 [Archangium sp. Cb G35]